jgi:hypothetical protein
LPKLKDGREVPVALSQYLNMRDIHYDSATLKIYVYALLINKKGNCEQIYCSAGNRATPANGREDFVDDDELTQKVKSWFRAQTPKD